MNRHILILLLMVPFASFAQKKIIYGKITVGNYWMTGLRNLQEEHKDQIVQQGIPAEVVLSFPASIQGEAGLDFIVYDRLLREYTVGGFISYMFTSGIINYTDYSGRIDTEHNLLRMSLGVRGAFWVKNNVQAYAKISYHLTNFQMVSRTTVYGSEPSENKVGGDSKGWAFEPGFQWTKKVKRFNLSLHGGYELSINKNTFFENAAGDAVYPGWSGFRLGAGLGFSL